MVHTDPMAPVAVPERLLTSVRALGPLGSRWLAELPDILAGLAADWSITYGRPLGGGNAAYVVEMTELAHSIAALVATNRSAEANGLLPAERPYPLPPDVVALTGATPNPTGTAPEQVAGTPVA